MDQVTLDQIRTDVSESVDSYMDEIREEVQFVQMSDLVTVRGNHYYAKEGLYPTLSENFSTSGSSGLA